MNGDRRDTLTTYRHVRLAMALLLALLLVAVVLRALSAPGICFEGSISAYYFTSVRAVFVTALCALGTCLIVYRGNRDAEDIALNASGALAFVVAFVPTRVPSATGVTCSASNVPGPGQLEDAVNNNMVATIIVSFVAIALAMVLVALSTRTARERGTPGPGTAPVVALWVFLGVLVLGSLAFALWPDGFRAHAHTTAAFGTFIGILAVVAINAFDSGMERSVDGLLKETRELPSTTLERAPDVRAPESVAGGGPGAGGDLDELRRRVIARKLYVGIWTAMVASMGVISLLYWRVSGWRHGVLWIEAALMIEFLAFWVVQTYELWRETRRDAPPVDALLAPT
ncbi:MAG TPA: hypothetical protein VFH36_14070 [Acidimicrobiales bacterium]|nr:hypothetical protein [Acidimicrobiales bacterium]